MRRVRQVTNAARRNIGSQSDKSGDQGIIVPSTDRVYPLGASGAQLQRRRFAIPAPQWRVDDSVSRFFCERTRLVQIRYFDAVSSDEFSIAKGVPKNESPKIFGFSNEDHVKRKKERKE